MEYLDLYCNFYVSLLHTASVQKEMEDSDRRVKNLKSRNLSSCINLNFSPAATVPISGALYSGIMAPDELMLNKEVLGW